jgi:hypothetical protein
MVDLLFKAEQYSPFAPAPLQNLHHYYGLFRPCAPHQYSRLMGVPHLNFFLSIRAAGSHVPPKSLKQVHAALTPDSIKVFARGLIFILLMVPRSGMGVF